MNVDIIQSAYRRQNYATIIFGCRIQKILSSKTIISNRFSLKFVLIYQKRRIIYNQNSSYFSAFIELYIIEKVLKVKWAIPRKSPQIALITIKFLGI